MESLKAGDLHIEVGTSAPKAPLRLVWRGKSNERHPGSVLDPFFAQVLDAARAVGVPVEMHFEEVSHFNSSTITSVIQLIHDAREKAIRLVIVYDSKQKWQKLSFDALKVFDKGDDLLELRG